MGAWIAGLFSGLAGLVTSWLANKTIFATSVVAGGIALTAAFVAALNAMASVLYGQLPVWAQGVGYLIPDNGALCFSTWTAAKIARWVYDYHMDSLKTAASV